MSQLSQSRKPAITKLPTEASLRCYLHEKMHNKSLESFLFTVPSCAAYDSAFVRKSMTNDIIASVALYHGNYRWQNKTRLVDMAECFL